MTSGTTPSGAAVSLISPLSRDHLLLTVAVTDFFLEDFFKLLPPPASSLSHCDAKQRQHDMTAFLAFIIGLFFSPVDLLVFPWLFLLPQRAGLLHTPVLVFRQGFLVV